MRGALKPPRRSRIVDALAIAVPPWSIPMVYVLASLAAGLVMPRLEQTYLAGHGHDMSVPAALAYYQAVASGMLSFTGVLFAIGFLVVQFSAVAYSPRLVAMFTRNRGLYHALGLFFATFTYSLAALAWTDRGGSGETPPISAYIVGLLLIASLLAFTRLVLSVNDLQVQNVLQTIARRGRAVIDTMPPIIDDLIHPDAEALSELGPASQILAYSGEPRAVAELDHGALLGLAESVGALIAVECAVGDTVMQEAVLLRVHGGTARLPERALRRAIRLATARTFEQDPKYALRLLADVAIRALSPGVNDPTTAVQALDQTEDLLRRLARVHLDVGYLRDATGAVRVTFPAPTWDDYLALAFDEIRQYGAASVQVERRLRSALVDLIAMVPVEERRRSLRRYLFHLNQAAGRSGFDDLDRASALQMDRQGLGLSRKRPPPSESEPASVDAPS
jgi:uncharacterized membrane protein